MNPTVVPSVIFSKKLKLCLLKDSKVSPNTVKEQIEIRMNSKKLMKNKYIVWYDNTIIDSY